MSALYNAEICLQWPKLSQLRKKVTTSNKGPRFAIYQPPEFALLTTAPVLLAARKTSEASKWAIWCLNLWLVKYQNLRDILSFTEPRRSFQSPTVQPRCSRCQPCPRLQHGSASPGSHWKTGNSGGLHGTSLLDKSGSPLHSTRLTRIKTAFCSHGSKIKPRHVWSLKMYSLSKLS